MASELERLREVMDKLRSPGGCPWDNEQDHTSLLKYLLEESYEFIESVENNDRQSMQEELGDLLLQVYLQPFLFSFLQREFLLYQGMFACPFYT